MTMFLGYGHMVDFFTSFDWWKTDPHDELVNNGNYCLAEPARFTPSTFPMRAKSPCSFNLAATMVIGSAL